MFTLSPVSFRYRALFFHQLSFNFLLAIQKKLCYNKKSRSFAVRNNDRGGLL